MLLLSFHAHLKWKVLVKDATMAAGVQPTFRFLLNSLSAAVARRNWLTVAGTGAGRPLTRRITAPPQRPAWAAGEPGTIRPTLSASGVSTSTAPHGASAAVRSSVAVVTTISRRAGAPPKYHRPAGGQTSLPAPP